MVLCINHKIVSKCVRYRVFLERGIAMKYCSDLPSYEMRQAHASRICRKPCGDHFRLLDCIRDLGYIKQYDLRFCTGNPIRPTGEKY